MKEYIKLFNNHQEYEAFTSTDKFIRPNVSHCIEENDVHYNPKGVLPENLELWEKFNQIYGDNVTSEDLELFSTYPMTYSISDEMWSVEPTYIHSLAIYTNLTACFGNTPNPDYKYAYLSFYDSTETTSIDDFIRDEYDGNSRWNSADCVK